MCGPILDADRRTIKDILVRGASAAFVFQVIGTGLAFVLQIVLARILTTQAFGDYAYAQTWLNFLGMTCVLGFDAAALRFLPALGADGDQTGQRAYISIARRVVAIASLAGAGGITIAAWLMWQQQVRLDLVMVFGATALALPVFTQMQLHTAFVQAHRKIADSRFGPMVVRPIVTGLVAWFLVRTLDTGWTAASAMMANLLASAVAFLLLLRVGKGLWTGVEQRQAPEVGEWGRVALSLLVVGWFHRLLGQTDMMMLGPMVGTELAGIYSAASKTSLLVGFGLTAANAIGAPVISGLYARGRIAELQSAATFITRRVAVFVAIGAPLLFWGAGTVLWVFGDEFVSGATALQVLVVGQAFGALVGPVGFLMTMTGQHVTAGYVMAACAALNLALNWILIGSFGIVGAAIATAVTQAAWNGLMTWFVIRRVGINPTILSRDKT